MPAAPQSELVPVGLLALLSLILPEIEKYGPIAIKAIIGIFTSKTAPTQAQWDALIQATSTTAREQMLEVLKNHGIDPNSPQGQAFLALTPA